MWLIHNIWPADVPPAKNNFAAAITAAAGRDASGVAVGAGTAPGLSWQVEADLVVGIVRQFGLRCLADNTLSVHADWKINNGRYSS